MSKNAKFMELLVTERIIPDVDAEKLRIKYHDDALEVLQHLLKTGVQKKDVLGKLWGDSIGFSYVNLEKTLFQSQVVHKLPETFAKKNQVIPLYEINNVVTLASASPADSNMINAISSAVRCPVSVVYSFPDEILTAIDIQYQSSDSIHKFIEKITENPLFRGTKKITAEQLKLLTGDQAIIDLSRNILLLGLKERASDIHIDPQQDSVYIRFRIDGVLQDRIKLDLELHSPLSSRLKILANLDITEKRRPQDGRINLSLYNKSIDFRFSAVPTIYGEKITLRILGQLEKNEAPDLSELNFSKDNLDKIKKVARYPNGIFLVTGPTGSGKSTTLFSILKHVNKPGVNIMTAEDPVEYRLPRINQVQINQSIGFDFAMALRVFLRQDPDIILIGEIRDLETAKIASQAALTGHLVLATLHTNTALQAITRLIEIGVDPFMVAPSIVAVMAQRLVRRVCVHCREKYLLTPEEIEKYFIWDGQKEVYFYRAKGCPECNHIGYLGRIAIHEVFIVTAEIKHLITKSAPIIEIEEAAKRAGFRNIRYDGMKKVLRGLTTVDELNAVTIESE